MIFEDGQVFVIDEEVFALYNYEPSVSYSVSVKSDSDHGWADIIELDYDTASYISLEGGVKSGEGEAVALTFDNYLILTPSEYDGEDALMLETPDDGETFANDYYVYSYYDPSAVEDPTAALMAQYEASYGDRSDYAYAAQELGVQLYTNYYSDLNGESYFYINDNGILQFYDIASGYTVPMTFEIDGSEFYIYGPDNEYMGLFEYNGSTFYEEESNSEYAPLEY
jgi:hypothetical protein